MILSKRKTAIGYATYAVGSRVARKVARRKARKPILERMTAAVRPHRRRLPLIGGAAAAAVAGAAVIARQRRLNGSHGD